MNGNVRYLHTSRSARDPHRVLASRERPAIEPAVARDDGEARLGEQRLPPRGLEPPQRHRRLAGLAAHRQRQRLTLEIPVGALEDARLALEPADPCVSSTSSSDGAKTSKMSRPPGTSSSRAARAPPAAPRRSRGGGSARNGQVTSGTRSCTGGRRRSPSRRSSALRHPRLPRLLGADGEHPGRGVDADHVDAGGAQSGSRSGPCRRRARPPGRPTRGPPRRRRRCPRRPRRSRGRRGARSRRKRSRRIDTVAAVDPQALRAGGAGRDRVLVLRRRARRRAREVPGPQERAEARAPRGARPRDGDGAERRPRGGSSRRSTSARPCSSARSSTGRLAQERVDVTPPRRRPHPRGHLHLIDADPPRGRGHLPRARLRRRRRPRGGDDALQLRRPQHAADTTSRARRSHTFYRRRGRRCCARETSPVADPHDGGAAATDLHGLARPRATGATRPTRRTTRSSTRSRASPSTAGSRSPT